MGKGKKLVILLLVVLVLAGGYIAATYFFKDEDEADDAQDTVEINAVAQDEIVGIQYNYGDEVITLTKKGDKWCLDDDPDFPVEQAFPDKIAADAAALTARRLVSNDANDFTEYGLDDPTAAYVFTKTDGEQVTYLIGNFNSYGGTYYLNVAGTTEIYLIEGEFLDDFDAGKAKLADVPEIETASTDQVTGLRMTLDDQTTLLQYYENGLDTAYTGTLQWFVDKDTPADTVQVHDLIGKAVSYSSNGCAAYKADEEQLQSFGLDAPILTLALQYTVTEEVETGKKDADGLPVKKEVSTDKALTLSVGGTADDGSLYAKLDSSDTVYLLLPEYLDTLRAFDLASLRSADVCKLSSDEVTAMDVTVGGKTHNLLIERGKDDAITYRFDGAQITAVQFNEFFSSIQSVVSEGFAREETDASETMRIVYHTNRTGHETMTLTIAPYDRNLYVARLQDGDGVLIAKSDFEAMQKAFEALNVQS